MSTNSPTYIPTSQAPTLTPSDQQIINEANGTILMIGLGILLMMIGFLVAMFLHRAWTVGKLNRLKRAMLVEQAKKMRDTGTGTLDEKEALIREFKKLELESRGVMNGVGENFVMPMVDSMDAQTVNEFVFHSSIGRLLTLSYKELNSQISWILGWMTGYLITGYVQTEIIAKSANAPRAYQATIGVTVAAFVIHKVFTMSTTVPIDRRMEENTVFYDQVGAFKRKNGFKE